MSIIKVAAIQFAPLIGNIDRNIEKVSKLIDSLEGVNLVVLPELASSGYRFADKSEAEMAAEEFEESKYVAMLLEKAADKNLYIVSGFNELYKDKLYNSSVLVGPDGVIGVYRKLHLFWDEKAIFEPGDKGIPVFDTPIGRIGMLICFDWMFPEVWRNMALNNVQIICHPSNLVLPYCQSAIPSYALINRIFIITANRIGTERDLNFTGGSIIVSHMGDVFAKASKDKQEIVEAVIDSDFALDKTITPMNDAFSDRRTDVYG